MIREVRPLLQITSLGKPTLFTAPDGTPAVSFAMGLSNGTALPLAVAVGEVENLFAYFLRLTEFLNDQGFSLPADDGRISGPFTVHSLGLGLEGATPDSGTILRIDLAGCRLGFSLNKEKLAELGESLSRIARTLSAHSKRPN